MQSDPLDPAAVLEKISRAREGLSKEAYSGAVRLTLTRHFGKEYWEGKGAEWLPRVAEFDVLVESDESDFCDLEVSVGSSPQGAYAYFPFAAFVYIDGQAKSIVEFTAADQERVAVITIPVGIRVTLSILTEQASLPATGGDNRELALVLRSIQARPIVHPQKQMKASSSVTEYGERWTRLVSTPPKPVFVVGAYRSGTSVLTWALGQHPNIWPLEETRWLQLLGAGAIAGYSLATAARIHYFDTYDVSRSEYLAHLGAGVDHFMQSTSLRRAEMVSFKRLSVGDPDYDERFQLRRSAFGRKERWVDGTPENADCILLLRELFPEARFICVLRDPKDVIASMANFERAGGESMDVSDAATMWSQRITNCMLAYRALGPDIIKVVEYDALGEPVMTLRDLFEFLDEPDFPASAETFSHRINSSMPTDAERKRVQEEIEISAEAAAASALYREFRTLLQNPWQRDLAASVTLAEIQHDLVQRLISAVS